MIGDSCPVPNKKLRTQGSPEQSDSEEWNLSKTFDEDYRILMNEEILQICKPVFYEDSLEISEVRANFHRACDELLTLIGNTIDKPRQKNPCRSDINLDKFEKIFCIERLFKSPRFTNINFLANVIITNQPLLESEVQKKLEELQSVWQIRSLNSDIDLPSIAKDIEADIDDLRVWQKDVDRKLRVLVDDHRMDCAESIENLLNDFKVHDDIINSITKMMEKFIQLDSVMMHNETLLECKVKLDELISLIHGQWLKAMELKLKLEAVTDMVSQYNRKRSLGINIFGQESGFESEISPLNPMRGLPTTNLCIMKYISSSGECLFDNNTTDFPLDSESSAFSVDLTNNSNNNIHHSSSSLIGSMMGLQRTSHIFKEGSPVRKKQKRFKKRRQQFFKSTEFPSENLSIQEREKYMQIRNAFYKQSHSLKRRISETDIIQALDRSEDTCRILDLAAAAEKIVMKNDLNHRGHSLSDSPKESELEGEDNVIIGSANELNVKEVWDNYQASLYSNDDGDSQIVEIENIRDWEQDPETDDQNQEGTQLQILTSGYETSMEFDTHLCNKNLINVLKFSTSQHCEANERLNAIQKQLDKLRPSTAHKMNGIINEQLSISNTHVKLLDQIINNDPCSSNPSETSVMEQICLIQREWEDLVRRLITLQSRCEQIISNDPLDKLIENVNKINKEISALCRYNELSDLRSTVDFLKEKQMELSNIHDKISAMGCDNDTVDNIATDMVNTAKTNIESRQKDLRILTDCTERLIECQKKRVYIEGELNCFSLLEKTENWQTISEDMKGDLKNTRVMLDDCLDDLLNVPSETCSDRLRYRLEEETRFLGQLDIQLALAQPMIDNLRSKRLSLVANRRLGKTSRNSVSGFLRRLPVQVAIFVIVAMCGLWFRNQSSYACQASSDWFKLLRNYTSNLEPH